MKNIFTLILLFASPLLLFAQQKNNTQEQQQQLMKEMEALRAQMQQQIQALQDSLAVLQQQLAEQQLGKHFRLFEYKSPDNGDYYLSLPDSFDWDHSFNFPCPEGDGLFPEDYQLWVPSLPQAPDLPRSYEFHYKMPDFDFYETIPYDYHFNMPELPPVPDFYHEKKHRHDDFWHSLPFYDWFKS